MAGHTLRRGHPLTLLRRRSFPVSRGDDSGSSRARLLPPDGRNPVFLLHHKTRPRPRQEGNATPGFAPFPTCRIKAANADASHAPLPVAGTSNPSALSLNSGRFLGGEVGILDGTSLDLVPPSGLCVHECPGTRPDLDCRAGRIPVRPQR